MHVFTESPKMIEDENVKEISMARANVRSP
jgi:hypothetical protein